MISLFLICLSVFLLLSAFFPFIQIVFFAPFLVAAARRLSYAPFLFTALLIGMLYDLVCGTPFGFYTLLATLTAMLAPLWTRLFFKEQRAVFLVTTWLAALVWSSLELILDRFFDLPLPVHWIRQSLITAPLLTMVYSASTSRAPKWENT